MAMTLMVLSATSSKRGMVFRFMPTLVLMPFITLYNNNIGMYGVHKEIDSIYGVVLGEGGQEETEDECEVRRLTRQFI